MRDYSDESGWAAEVILDWPNAAPPKNVRNEPARKSMENPIMDVLILRFCIFFK
jgi:hypothetical protein